jgi:shikimate kinase
MAHIGGMAMLEEQARLASVHMNANLYLYGAPGSGKSTYAKKLAAGKAMPLVDLDAEIEKAQGRTIAEIFAADGEAAFRRIEKTALEKTAAKRGQIVALGGGALLDGDSRRLAEATGRIVFIDCPEEKLLRRVSASETRPLLAGDRRERLHRLLSERRERYAAFKERIFT